MKHLDLFSGIGGFALACEWAGIKTIGFVEIDKFCQKVLKKHWPDVKIVEDVNNVEEIKRLVAHAELCGCLHGQAEKQPTERGQQAQPDSESGCEPSLLSSHTNRDADLKDSLLLTAGFPCQPFSNAGRKRGASDDRYLWPQTLAVIKAVKPDWVLLENVAGILNMVFPDSATTVASQASLFTVQDDKDGFGKVLGDYNTIAGGIDSDLRQAGYETVWLVIPACGVSAPHRRDRVWIVANTKSSRVNGISRDYQEQARENGLRSDSSDRNPQCDAPNTSNEGLQGGKQSESTRLSRQSRGTGCDERGDWHENWYEVATRFCRIYARLSDWLDANGGLLNGQTENRVTTEDLQNVWQEFQQDDVWEYIRGHYKILEKEVLLTTLCKLQERAEGQDYILFESKAIQENILREMPLYGFFRYTPQEWEYQRQQSGEHCNSMSPLSHEIALATESLIWWYQTSTKNDHRVDRLKALGNAIVPQVAYQIIKTIVQVSEVGGTK